MKADLAKREPEILEKWQKDGLYPSIMKLGEAREKYTLHDGPPYANGNIHIGHALNKILKDIVVKSRFMNGFSTDYVPGWDCHGLPIELQVEKNLGKSKDTLKKTEIRKLCREYAEKFVSIQKEEFKRLGVLGAWDDPYLTMSYGYQATILRELGRLNATGCVYKGKKPVHWCASCKTALAEAEVEYADKKSPSVFVKFRVKDAKGKFAVNDKDGTFFVIWTTTPWTLPANLAVAVQPDGKYALVKTAEGGLIVHSDLVKACVEKFELKDGEYSVDEKFSFEGKDLEGIVCEHPFIGRESRVILGDFVTTEAGTGCVHIAPGHGHDDYQAGLKYGLDIYAPVDNSGKFTSDFKEFEGTFVFKANDGIIELLKSKDALLKKEDISHSYPHCWRCKSPIIFRATAQWFVSMEDTGLRKTALKSIDSDVQWIPSWGRDRIYNMVANRPDWCLSRQRAWGVPIPALSCKKCGESFLNEKLIEKLAVDFEKNGADVWFARDVKELIPEGTKCPKCGSSEFDKEEDILDVWFDSGVSFSAVVEKRANLGAPARLYLEGSDQHRGWFQSALLTSVGTRKAAPYKAVLTHGFVVDGNGKKMSKSTGNVIAPQEVIKTYGAEVLRLWVAAEDYREDIRISEEILKRLSEAYRRIRNTMRFILGNISDFDPDKDAVPYDKLLELDRLTLHRLELLKDKVLSAYESFEFHVIYHTVHNFCAVDLSSFYLDIVKDRLYTSGVSSLDRRAAQTTMHKVLDTLLRLLSPVLVFTTDEAWGFMPGKKEASVHLSAFPKIDKSMLDEALAAKWERIAAIKAAVSKALEAARRDKVIGHPLDARVEVSAPEEPGRFMADNSALFKDALIVSAFDVVGDLSGEAFSSDEIPGLKVRVTKAVGTKCERCWHINQTVGTNSKHVTVCERCAKALG